ncbi:MAG: LPXTG cell wall anchor domain-containing protein [Sulfuritalea sp.]|nr:LPXTG cell wall anchor domain-containing protein [Sulfuritalea sp.]
MKQVRALLLATVIALPAWAGGDSSDGHTHAAPEPIPVVTLSPRAAAATEDFEVVAAIEGKKLVVYLDRFASNEPVTKAVVEVDGGGLKGVAGEIAPGTYTLDLATAMSPGKHPLTIAIEAGDTTDLLTTTLDISPAAAGEEHVHGWSERIVWIVAGLLLLAAGALLAMRRRNKSKGI